MKKLLGLMALLIAAVTFTSCGNDEPDPIPTVKGIYSTLSDGSTNYEKTTEKYYKFDVMEDVSTKYLYIYNVKFDPRMPISITMRVPLTSVQVKKTANGYAIDQNEAIIPDLYRGGTWTPYAEREVTNLHVNIDTKAKTFTLTMTCIGIAFNDEGKLYIQK